MSLCSLIITLSLQHNLLFDKLYNPSFISFSTIKKPAVVEKDKPIKKENNQYIYNLMKKYKVKNPHLIVNTVDRVCKELEKEFNLKIDKHLIYAVIEIESGFRNLPPNKFNATGYMQVTPIAYKSVQKDLNISGSLLNPYVNIKVGTYYLYRNIEKYGLDHALVIYNAGYKNLNRRVIASRGSSTSYLNKVKERRKVIKRGINNVKVD